MALIALLAVVTGRQANSARALVLAVIGVAAVYHGYLTDVGWQLSVLVTVGIIWLEPLIAKKLSKLPEIIAAPLSVSLAAGAFTWPIIVYNFGIFSLVSVPTNILVDWALLWIMAIGAFSLVLGSVWLELGQIMAYLVWVPLTYFVDVVKFMSQLPDASIKHLFVLLGSGGWLLLDLVRTSHFMVQKSSVILISLLVLHY